MKKQIAAAVMMGASLLAISLASAPAIAQDAQMASRQIYQGFGVTVTRQGDRVTVNGAAAEKAEYNADADVYIQGPYRLVFHKRTGKVRLMKDGSYVGVLK
ncbi:hypothetical protein [Kluyvera georgiana]|uniref:hypothetical protein n=1 Tax=Kluyvera georgiana TaxID=73098 RepID=UPI0013D9965C|nr:hypothetical protein [Kluyvera georgiana]